MPIHVSRAPVYFREFFAPTVTNMRGMSQIMMDMCENPGHGRSWQLPTLGPVYTKLRGTCI